MNVCWNMLSSSMCHFLKKKITSNNVYKLHCINFLYFVHKLKLIHSVAS